MQKLSKAVLSDLEPLKNMGEICKNDIYHSFRNFDTKMLAWIENIKRGTICI